MLERVTRLELIAEQTAQALVRLDTRMDRLESRMDRLDTRMDRLESRMDAGFAALRTEFQSDFREIRRDMRTQFYWLLALLLASGAATLGRALGLLH